MESQKASESSLLLEADIWGPVAGGFSDGKLLVIASSEGLMIVQRGTLIASGISLRMLEDLFHPHNIQVLTRERMNAMLERAEKNGEDAAIKIHDADIEELRRRGEAGR